METLDSEAGSKEDSHGYSDEERYDETDQGIAGPVVSIEKHPQHPESCRMDSDSTNGLPDEVKSGQVDSSRAGLVSNEDPPEAEDGEILEDGEIDDDEEDGEEDEEQSNYNHEEERQTDSVPHGHGGHEGDADEVEKNSKQKLESESEEEEGEPAKEKRKKDRKRRKRQREKDKKKRFKDDSRRKRKRHEYVDYDKAEEQLEYQPKIRRRSPPGQFDSPYQSPEEKGKHSPPGPYDSPYRSPPGPYDSPPDSPPGPYDSPPEDSDDEDRYGEQNNHRKRPKKSMLGMLEDAYLDPNIAVSEKQDIFQSSVRGRNRGRGKPMKGMPQQPRKKPLLETPRAARPLCKFYKEGKCAKGSQCPFNHDFTPPKKSEICKFYLNSTCNKGRECIYMHGEYPCKFFHTGAQCFGGDLCKFSHDPLTAETYPLLTKILDNDDDDFTEFQPKAPRPSLLGSPPRHVKEAAERMKGNLDPSKKIPSLLDIEVFPPKQSPQKQQNSPSSEAVSPQPGSLHCRPGFYSETTTTTTQPNYNSSAVLALGALLKQAASQSPSARFPFQSPPNPGYTGEGRLTGSQETEESEVDNSQDTQKLEDESSQEDGGGIKIEDGMSDEDKRQANIEVPSHLPPKQRELFLRIQQQQREETKQDDMKKEDPEPVDDDDWYSSDEEESGQPKAKLMDMLKNISPPSTQTPKSSASVTQPEEQAQPKLSDSGSSSGSFNILQMLNAIRGQTSVSANDSQGPTPSANQLIESLLPQSAKDALVKSDPRVAPDKTPPQQTASTDVLEQLPRVPKDGSDLPYKVVSISVVKGLYLPPNLDMNDPCVSNDPRIQHYSSRAGPPTAPKLERQISNKTSSDTENTENKLPDPRRTHTATLESAVPTNPVDPRKRPVVKTESPSDPRRKDSSVNTPEDLVKTADPRLQRAVTELIQSAVVKQDPRIQKSQSNPAMMLHNVPVRPPVRPGFPMGFPGPPPGVRPMGPGPLRPPGGLPMGPRSGRPPLLRTPIMPDNSFRPRGPRPFIDPRLSRQNCTEIHYGPPPPQGGPRLRPQGMSPVREHPQNFGPTQSDPRTRPMGISPCRDQHGPAPNDPRLRSQNPDPSNLPQNPSDPRLRSQGSLQEGKPQTMKMSDPRLERQGGSLDSGTVQRSSDPRLHRQTSQPAMSPNRGKLDEGQTDNTDNRPPSRLDPRAQSRSEVDTGSSTEPKLGSSIIKKKKFIGQRKGSMEYSSPLGLGSDQPDPAVSGFSSYSRPTGNRQPTNNRQRSANDQPSGTTQGSNLGGPQSNDPRGKMPTYSNSPTYSGYSSPLPHEQSCDGEHMEIQPVLQPPLKDLFKTIDPTASPFC